MSRRNKRKIPYENSPHKFRVPECYKNNSELLERRATQEDVKKKEKEENFLKWYKCELRRKGYKFSKNVGNNKMVDKTSYKKYILDPNNPPMHGLRVSFPTKRGIKKIREEASKRGIRNIKSTYYGHYVSVVPPELVTEEIVKWLNSHKAIRENLPVSIDQLFVSTKKIESEPIKVDTKKWASWAKKL
jgi:hypothetical protein